MEKITLRRRIYPDKGGSIVFKAGDYIKDPKDGFFIVCMPNGKLKVLNK